MRSRKLYKICICLVILGLLQPMQIYLNALLFRKSLMLLNIQKTQPHFPMYIFPLLILKPKIYYK